jgi:hypothetical protein
MLRLLSPIGLAIVQEGFGIYPGRFDRDRNGNLIYITGVNNSGWINVYALKRRDGKTYYRFGYNLNEQRWAFGVRPAVDRNILSPTSDFKSLDGSSTSSSRLGWRIIRAVLIGAGKVFMVLAEAAIYICGVLVVVVLRLLASSMKPRRRRRF